MGKDCYMFALMALNRLIKGNVVAEVEAAGQKLAGCEDSADGSDAFDLRGLPEDTLLLIRHWVVYRYHGVVGCAAMGEMGALQYMESVRSSLASLPMRAEVWEQALRGACWEGHAGVVGHILSLQRADVNSMLLRGRVVDTPLLTACRAGHLGICHQLLDAGAIVDHRLQFDCIRHPFFSCQNLTDITRFVITHGPKPEGSVGAAALRIAVSHNRKDLVRLLNEMGVTLTCGMALECASSHGYIDMVRYILSKGGNAARSCTKALDHACRNGHTEVVEILIENGANVNHAPPTSAWSRTLLQKASQLGHADVASVLVANGARVDHEDDYGYDALALASERGHHRVVEILITSGADPNLGGGLSLCVASEHGHLEVVCALLRGGAAVTAEAVRVSSMNGHLGVLTHLFENANPDPSWIGPAIISASRNGHVPTVSRLLEIPQNPGAADLDAALASACRYGHSDVAQALAERGCNVNQGGVLSMACRSGSADLVQCLIKHGAEVNGDGSRPLFWACENPNPDVIRCLIDNGADVNASLQGASPLDAACENGYIEIVRALVEGGANISARPVRPLLVASSNLHFDIVNYLYDLGLRWSDDEDGG